MEIFNENALLKAEEEVRNFAKEEAEYSIITEADVAEAEKIRRQYHRGKRNLEDRIVLEEKAWKLKLYDYYDDKGGKRVKPSSSAYMWNAVVNKHADMMDNIPEPVFLPREESDKKEAELLSGIVPVILDRNNFEQIYSDSEWYRIKHGTSCIGVFWDSGKDSGRGDVSIKTVDLLNIFFKPGIKDIQDSPNFFICEAVERDAISKEYPGMEFNSGSFENILTDYDRDESYDYEDKVLVVDWYYKRRYGDKVMVHLCKYCQGKILYSSENDPEYTHKGFYNHGMYPVVLNTLYPEEDSCCGYGLITVGLSSQVYIDELDALTMNYAKKALIPRWFAKKSAGINKQQYSDWDEPIVEVEGDIDEEKLKQIAMSPISAVYYNLLQRKIDELKETTGTRDFNTGGTMAGVTSGAAIATLQEAGNKTTRDAIKSDYRAYVKIINLVLELIRQFYKEDRTFRIMGNGKEEFISYSNKEIGAKIINDMDGNVLYSSTGEALTREPIFDIAVKAQKTNPYSRLSQNETAAELYKMGVFKPENAREALIMLGMMDFEGKDEIIAKISYFESMNHEELTNEYENLQRETLVPKNKVKGSYGEKLVENARRSFKEEIL